MELSLCVLRFVLSLCVEDMEPGPGARAEPGPGSSLGSSNQSEASCSKRGVPLASQQGGAVAAWWSSCRSDGQGSDIAEMG